MTAPRHPAFWYTAFAIWFGVLWWLSSEIRTFPTPVQFYSSDKVLHFGYFFGGAGLLSAAIFRTRPEMAATRRILIAILVVALVGVIDELHQSTVPGRDATITDFIADTLGAIAGSLVFQRFRKVLA
jgi:VanZ family protein